MAPTHLTLLLWVGRLVVMIKIHPSHMAVVWVVVQGLKAELTIAHVNHLILMRRIIGYLMWARRERRIGADRLSLEARHLLRAGYKCGWVRAN